jgi:putative spermidine/putrescine transport system permease protein
VDGEVTPAAAVAKIRPGLRLSVRPSWGALALPGLLFLLVVFVYPVWVMVERSFTDPSPENYTVLVQSDLYGRVLLRTLETGLLATAACLLLGYPFAYLMAASTPRWRAVLILIVLLPFWTSWLVRTFALIALLQDTGLINRALQSLGVISEPLPLIRTTLGVTIGLTYILLPFMILPLYAVMQKIDGRLVQAAQSLGATRRQAFFRVFVPLSLPGVVAGSFLVFVLSVGFYVTPALLGGSDNMMIGQLISVEISELLRFGRGSALGVVLLVTVGLLVYLGSRLGPVARAFRGDL